MKSLNVSDEDAKKIEKFFLNEIKKHGELWRAETERHGAQYKFNSQSDYAIYQFFGGPNCATIVIDALKYAGLENELNVIVRNANSPALIYRIS